MKTAQPLISREPSYTATGLTPATEYSIGVKAYADDSYSDSDSLTITETTTALTKLATPTGLSETGISQTGAILSVGRGSQC